MIATQAKLLDFLKKSPQFVIPIYHAPIHGRTRNVASFGTTSCALRANDRISVHFVGSIVYIEQGLSQVTHQSPLLVIDGQQRLTTVTLLIAALAKAVGEIEPLDGFSAAMLRGYYLINPLEKGERKFKLILSQTDKNSLTAIAANQEQPQEQSLRVTQNFALFAKPYSPGAMGIFWPSAKAWPSLWWWTSRSIATRTTRSSFLKA